MNTIIYKRYLIDPSTWQGIIGLKIEQVSYHVELDHIDENDLPKLELLNTCEEWLNQHFGEINITINDFTIRLSNLGKLGHEFLVQGIQIKEAK